MFPKPKIERVRRNFNLPVKTLTFTAIIVFFLLTLTPIFASADSFGNQNTTQTTTANYGIRNGHTLYTGTSQMVGQAFNTTGTGEIVIDSVKFKLYPIVAGTPNIRITIYVSNNTGFTNIGIPSGIPIVYNESTVSVTGAICANSPVEFVYNFSQNLSRGQEYYFVISSSNTGTPQAGVCRSNDNYYKAGFDEETATNWSLFASQSIAMNITYHNLTTSPVPTIIFLNQNPVNITQLTLATGNITQSYSYGNATFTNDRLLVSLQDGAGYSCLQWINGTCNLNKGNILNITPDSITNTTLNQTVNYTLTEEKVAPYNQNLPYPYFTQVHNAFNLSTNTRMAKVEIQNVVWNVTTYDLLEVMANTTGVSRVYACNSTYTTGSVLTSANCLEIGTINTTTFNHSDGNSKENFIPFIIGNGKVNGILTATDTMQFVIRGPLTTGGTTVWFINNQSRTGAAQTTTNSGGAWTNQAFTFDVHLHQYPSNLGINTTAQGNWTTQILNSTTTTEIVDLEGVAPTAPVVTHPFETNQATEFMNITWLASLPSSPTAKIQNYTVVLLNSDFSQNAVLKITDNKTTSFYWDVYLQNLSIGEYFILVRVNDSLGFNSFDQEEFNLTRNAILNLTIKDGTNNTILTNGSFNLTVTGYPTETYNVTTNVTTVNVIKNTNANITIYYPGYAVTSEVFTASTANFQTRTMYIFKTNSVTFRWFDSTSFALLTGNSTVTLTQNLTSLQFNTTNGTYFASNLPEGTWTVSATSVGYSTAFFTLNIQNQTTQTLDMFLTANFNSYGFYAIDPNNAPIVNLSITVQDIINGSYVTVNQKFTDVLGFAIFQLTEGHKYHFIMTPPSTNFFSKTFDMEVYTANQPYRIIFTTGGLFYYTSFYQSANYDYSPMNTTLQNKSQTFSITSLAVNGTILWTYVNCDGGHTQNVSGFPNGATASTTVDLSNFSGTYNCNYQLAVDQFPVKSFTIHYYITGSLAGYPNANLAEAADKAKTDISSMGSGAAWLSILAIFLIAATAVLAHQLSMGMSKISTVAALAMTLVMASLGWLSTNTVYNWSLAAFIVIIGGFLTWYKEVY